MNDRCKKAKLLQWSGKFYAFLRQNKWIKRWWAIPGGVDPARRRGQLLNLFILGTLALAALVALINTMQWLTSPSSKLASYVAADVFSLLVFAGLWRLARRAGRVTWAGYGYLAFLIAATSALFAPRSLDRGLIGYALPVVLASFIIGPRSSFIAAGLSALGYTLAHSAGHSPLSYNYVSVAVFFVLALAAWAAAELLEREIAARQRTEESLRLKNRVFDVSITANSIADALGAITQANTTFLHMWGYSSQAEVAGKLIRDLLQNEQEALTILAALNQTGRWEGDYTARRKDGSTFIAHSLATALQDENGMLIGYQSAVLDITERKCAEEQLAQSEAALKQAQRVAHVGSWAWHIQENQLEWSDEMFHIFGLAKENFTGELTTVIARAIHPDDRVAVEQANLAVTNEKRPAPLEYRIVWPDSTIRTVWAEAGELILGEAGRPAILTGIVQDITERKRAEEALHYQQDLMREMGRVAKIGGWEFDSTTRKGTWTEEVAKIHDVAPNDMTDVETGLSFYQGESRVKIEKAIKEAIELGQPYDLELELMTAKGIHKWVHTIGYPIVKNGKVVKVRGSFQDITDRKQAEARLTEQLDELRRWHAATLEREARVVELKREVNALLAQAGQPPRYPSAETAQVDCFSREDA